MSARPKDHQQHRAPADCPVCGDHLSVTRLGCGSCGSELAGVFAPCEYCALNDADSELLRVFLSSRGNLREVEKHLGVSYPTARARFATLLEHLGLAEDGPATGSAPAEAEAGGGRASRDAVLSEVAAGRLDPAEAARLLGE